MTRVTLLVLLVLLAPAASAADITIPGFSYSPGRIEVAPGANVTVLNLDGAPHSVKHASFDSGVLDQNEEGSFAAPTAAGEYVYVCGVHGSSMKGTLTVRAATSATPAPPTPATPEPTPTPTPAPATPTPATPPPSTPTPGSPAASTPVEMTPVASTPAGTTPAAVTPAAEGGTSATTPGPGLALVALALGIALVAARRRVG